MSRPFFRIGFWYAFFIAGFTILDLVLDRIFDDIRGFELVHVLFAMVIMATAYFLLGRTNEIRQRAQETLRQARDELEIRVMARTAEFEHANEALQKEVLERKAAQEEREMALTQVEDARRQAEDLAGKLRQANNVLRTLIETLPVGLFIIDVDGEIVLANSLARSMRGSAMMEGIISLNKDLTLCHPDGSYFPPEDRPLQRAMRRGETIMGKEILFRYPDGSQIHSLLAVSPLLDASGAIMGAVEVLQDIGDYKRMEHALRESELTARALMDASFESALLIDTQGVVLAANQTAARRFNTTIEQMLGASIFQFFSPKTDERRKNFLERVLSTGEAYHFEGERDGRWTVLYLQPILDEGGSISRIAVFGQDVTESRQAERRLRESEERYRTQFDNFSEPTTIWDRNGVLLMQNLVSARNLGGECDEYLGKTVDEIYGAAAPGYMERIARVIDTGIVEDQEDVVELASEKRYFWTRVQRITIPDGRAAAQMFSYDITERKQAEEALRAAQVELARGIKERTALEERQRLARELHDSVSQALYGISLGSHTALALMDSDRGKVLEALNYVISLAQAGLTEMRALIFELRPESLELEGLVAALTKQSAAMTARHGIAIQLSLCYEPNVPLTVKEALYRIAQEALHNALKYARSDQMDVRLVCEEKYLLLEICDNGVGFDPLGNFPGHLGLRSMRERAESVGGSLVVVSNEGCGTQIRARVPLHQPAEAAAAV